MKCIEFKFNGRVLHLSFTAEALFSLYDTFGVTDDIVGDTKIFEPTLEGWRNCCFVAALLAQQGELVRRYMGYDPQPLISIEELRDGFMAADSIELRRIVRAALEQGMQRTVEKDEDGGEINLILAEREKAEKKTKALSEFVLSSLRPLWRSFISE